MEQYISKAVLVAEIEKLQLCTMDEHMNFYSAEAQGEYNALSKLESFIDNLEVKEVKEEPVSNDLEVEIKHYVYDPYFDLNGVAVKGATNYLTVEDVADIARHFAQWQKEQMIDKACNYLFSHMGLCVTFFDDDIVEDIERSKFIKKFRIAMEDKL